MEVNVQANFFAYVMLFSWPLFGIAFFAMFPPRWACAITLIGGEMFLPANFSVHFHGLLPLDKDLMVSLAAFIGCLVVRPGVILRGNKSGRGYFVFILILIVGSYFTVQTNPDPIPVGYTHRVLPALTFHDFLSMSMQHILYWWPAFLLGRKLFTKTEDLEVLCIVFTVGGLIYSLFIFVELKMSPQFLRWFYGYGVASFEQTIRGGGYRPSVFMNHGLTLARFMLVSLLAAIGLAQARIQLFGVPARWLAIYLALVLVACHSAGAIVSAVLFVPPLLWARTRSQARYASLFAWFVLLYPLLRFYDLTPVDSIVGFFNATLGAERAGSLAFRLVNERELLGRAAERPWFGWGGYARQVIFLPWGAPKTIGDGQWIEALGYSGVVGLVGTFGLMIFPMLGFARRLDRLASRRGAKLGAAVLFIGGVYVFDLIPNSSVAPYLLMTAGAMAGIKADAWSEDEEAARLQAV
jgi:hypothetical protein